MDTTTRTILCLDVVFDRMQQSGWHVLKGNHEDFVVNEQHAHPDRAPWLVEVFQHSTWTCRQILDLLDDVAALPDRIDLEGPWPFC